MNFPPAKPPRFRIGQAIVCIDPTITHEGNASIKMHLNMNTVYLVCRQELRRGCWFLTLDVWTEFVFEEIHFAPAELLPDEAVAALVAESLEAVPA